jgi:hypothetical protein
MSAIDITRAPDPAAHARDGDATGWSAIIAGAVTMVAVSLVLMVLASALGLTIVSPWRGEGASAATFAVSSGVAVIVIQWIASAFGGYVTGRLRIRSFVRTDEVYFRDTAHGFLAWSVATILVASLLTSTVTSIASGVGSAVATVTGGAAQGAVQSAANQAGSTTSDVANPSAYFVDMLFRRGASPSPSSPTADTAAVNSEAGRILARGAVNGTIPDEDKAYLAQLVASRTGLAEAEARQRVDQVLARAETARTQAKEAADKARKAGMTTGFMLVLSLIVGAFIASVSSAYGGHHRDEI